MTRSRRARLALLLCASLVLAVVACEVALRIWLVEDGMLLGKRPLPPFAATSNPDQRAWVDRWRGLLARGETWPYDIGTFSTSLGWDHLPSARSADVRHDYSTNALGARGPREYAAEPAAGTLRIACFGDSFTFCDEVPSDATWQSALEAALPNCEAINFGVGGYGTDQALLRFRERRAHTSWHVVTIGLMLENIGRNVNRYRPLYYPQTRVAYPKPRFVLDDASQLVLLPIPHASFAAYLDDVAAGSILQTLGEHEFWSDGRDANTLGGIAIARLAAGYFVYSARDHRRLWEDPSGEPFQTTLALLEQFRREALATGAVAAPVLLFPAQSDLEALLTEGVPYWTQLSAELERRAIPHVDLGPRLAALCTQQSKAAASLYTGGHLDAAANRSVATALGEWLTHNADATWPAQPRAR